MNLKRATIILLIISLILIIIAFIGYNYRSDYLRQINYDELKHKIKNKETFILYISNKSCSHCKQFEPKFKKIVNEYKITVFKMDTATLTTDQYSELIIANVGQVGTPTVAFFKNGIEKGSYSRISGDVDNDTVIEKFKDNGYIKD